MSIRVLIIVTSPTEKFDRFTGNPSEWENAWGFQAHKKIAARVPASESLSYYENIQNLPKLKPHQEAIIWFNTKAIGEQNINGHIDEIINLGDSINQTWIAYHDVVEERIPENIRGSSSQYSLENNQRLRFQPILTSDNKLKADARFEDLLECFCINMPKRVARFGHRVAHLFTPIHVDMQGLKQTNFRSDYWEKVAATYQAQKPTRLIDEANGIKEELRAIANEDQKHTIDQEWKTINLEEARDLLAALEAGNLTNTKQESEKFLSWFDKFLKVLNDLDQKLSSKGQQ